MGKKRRRPEGGFIPPEHFGGENSATAVRQRRIEKRTGVSKSDRQPWEPAERDYCIDMLLKYWPDKVRFQCVFLEAFPNRSNEFESNNGHVWHWASAERKDIIPTGDPLRRAGKKWKAGDNYILKIATREANVRRGACSANRVAFLLRRTIDEVVPHIRSWLRDRDTLKLAIELGYFKK
jgi:hypothetical protein